MDHDGHAGGGNLRYIADSGTNGTGSASPHDSAKAGGRTQFGDPDIGPSIVDGATLLETEQVLLRIAPGLLAHTSCIRREGRVDHFVPGTRMGFRQYDPSVCGDAVIEIIEALEAALAQNRRSSALQTLAVRWRRVLKALAES